MSNPTCRMSLRVSRADPARASPDLDRRGRRRPGGRHPDGPGRAARLLLRRVLVSGRGFISAETPQQCDFCGEIAELRPYGPKRETICIRCARKDPEAMKRGIRRHIFGEDV